MMAILHVRRQYPYDEDCPGPQCIYFYSLGSSREMLVRTAKANKGGSGESALGRSLA